MKLSVITVCYNSESTIERTITSVLNQTYSEIEYIVIDGASTDNTVSVISKYREKLAYFASEKDYGVYDAMNKGIRAATGPVLFFLNSDDIFCDETVVEKSMEIIQATSAQIIYGDVLTKELNGELLRKSHADLDKMYFLYNTICHQAIFFRAEAFKICGDFDLRYKIAADFEFLLRAFLSFGITSQHFNLPIAVFARGGISSNGNHAARHAAEWQEIVVRYFNKFEVFIYSNPVVSRLMRFPKLRGIAAKALGWTLPDC